MIVHTAGIHLWPTVNIKHFGQQYQKSLYSWYINLMRGPCNQKPFSLATQTMKHCIQSVALIVNHKQADRGMSMKPKEQKRQTKKSLTTTNTWVFILVLGK